MTPGLFITFEGIDGAGKSSHIEALAAAIPVLTPDLAIADHYGEIRAHLAAAGTPIGSNDLFIAAHARSRGLTLVTHNLREFARVPGLKTADWLAAPG